MQLFRDGAAKIHIPLSSMIFNDSGNIDFEKIQTPEVRDFLLNLIAEDLPTVRRLRWVDFGQGSCACAALIAFYNSWLLEHGWKDYFEISCSVSITNAWRVVPIVDSPSWITLIQEMGWPISSKEVLTAMDFQEDTFRFSGQLPMPLGVAAIVGLHLGFPRESCIELIIDAIARLSNLEN
jgi:hypothetical protein